MCDKGFLGKSIKYFVVVALILSCPLFFVKPAEAMRVIDYKGTDRSAASPQTILTIYNQTPYNISIYNLPGWHKNFEYDSSHSYNDLRAVWAKRANLIPPYSNMEYRGLLGPGPGVVGQGGYIGEWGIAMYNGGWTCFNLWLHGETRGDTPYDLDWSEGGDRQNVADWKTRDGQPIPNTKDLKTKIEDRMSRFAVQSRLDNKWYVVTFLLGNRAHGSIDSDPSHLVIVIQEADPSMTTVNF